MAIFETFPYCENAVSTAIFGLSLSQPVNTFSNLIFFSLAALLLRENQLSIAQKRASYLLFLVGLTSTVWHATLLPQALLIDSIAVFSLAGFICLNSSFMQRRESNTPYLALVLFLFGSLTGRTRSDCF